MTNLILQYFGTGLGVLSLMIITFRPGHIVVGMIISSISCIALSIYGYITGQYGIFISQTAYVVLYALAAYNWVSVAVSTQKKGGGGE